MGARTFHEERRPRSFTTSLIVWSVSWPRGGEDRSMPLLIEATDDLRFRLGDTVDKASVDSPDGFAPTLPDRRARWRIP